jgi:hypothetical protein
MTYEHTIKGGANYSTTLTVTDGSGAPVTLTGGTVASHIRRVAGDSLLAAFSCSVSNVNQVTLSLPASVTSSLPATSNGIPWVHDALCTLSGGNVIELLEGTVLVSSAVTHA